VGALHLAWARGASWPLRDRATLGAAVAGVREDNFPGTGVTFVAGGLFLAAAGLVALHERRGGRAARLGAGAVSAVLLARGAVGLARPGLLPAGEVPPFPRLNARLYSPLCLLGGAAIARSVF
jgi:hypothetical protein